MSLKIENKLLTEAELLGFKRPAAASDSSSSDGSSFGALLKHAETHQSEAAQELEKLAKMTPEQRMAQAIMKQLGITQEQYDAMSPEQKAAVDAKIAQIMKQKMDEQMAQKQQGGTTLASGISL